MTNEAIESVRSAEAATDEFISDGRTATERLERLVGAPPEPRNDEEQDDVMQALFPTPPQSRVPQSRRQPRMYEYCRMFMHDPNNSRHGWLGTGPASAPNTAIMREEFIQFKGAEFLGTEYGVDVGGDMFKGPTRFKKLIANGGLRFFPKSQIVAYGWHRIEAIKNELLRLHSDWTFDDVPDIKCQYCPNRYYTTEERHMIHVEAMHQAAHAPRAIGREFGTALERMSEMQATATTTPQAMAAMMAQALVLYDQMKAEQAAAGVTTEGSETIQPEAVDGPEEKLVDDEPVTEEEEPSEDEMLAEELFPED